MLRLAELRAARAALQQKRMALCGHGTLIYR